MANVFYEKYVEIARAAARAFGVPEDLFIWQIGAESNWNPYAYNPASGASGIAQFIPSTAAEFGIDPMNPEQAIWAAAKYDAQLYKKYGSWLTALQRYGTLGPSASQRTLAEGVPLAQAADAAAGASGVNKWFQDIFGRPLYVEPSNPALQSGAQFPERTGVLGAIDKLTSADLWQRVGLVVLALIIIAGALYIFGTQQVSLTKMVK